MPVSEPSYGHPWAAPDTPMPEPQRPTRTEMREALRRIASARGRKDATLDEAADYALSVLDGTWKMRDADNPFFADDAM